MGSYAVAADGAHIAFDEVGDGSATVLLHGITESRRSWDPLVEPLAEIGGGRRVVTIDLRGHGDSDAVGPYDLVTIAMDVAAVVDHLGIVEPSLIGHSLGGTVVSAYASAFPVDRVINVDQPLRLAEFQAGVQAMAPMLRSDAFGDVIVQLFDSMAGRLTGTERDRVEAIRSPRREVVLGVWAALIESDPESLEAMVEDGMGSVTAPYLSLHGIDPGDGYSEWLTSLIPTASVEVWPGLGHYPHLVEPDRFVERVAEFFA